MITFSRADFNGVGIAFLAALGLLGCAPASPPIAQPQPQTEPEGPGYATVAAVRPIVNPRATEFDPQKAILAAMGLPWAPGAAIGASSEIVVRTDGGEIPSVVQPDPGAPASSLKLGERVMVVPGGGGTKLVLPARP